MRQIHAVRLSVPSRRSNRSSRVGKSRDVSRTLRRKIGKPVELIGLISDTHGLVRALALDMLRGVDLIIHAGDIGKPEVLDALKPIAPLHAIKGNNDRGAWAKKLPDTMLLAVGGVKLYLIHDVH